MNSINKTLYIPLYGKSYVSKKGLFFGDKKAEEIWEAARFTLKGKSKSKWLAYYMGIRSAVFDEWLNQRMTDLQDAVIIHIGCGMDSRVIRIGTDNHKWYDVDFAEVITERRKYYSESEHYQMIAGDAKEIEEYILSRYGKEIYAVYGMSMGGVLTATLWQNNRLSFDKVIFDGSPLVSYNSFMKVFIHLYYTSVREGQQGCL